MNAPVRRVLQAAMKLPPAARAALAGNLILSLDEPVDPDSEKAWTTEIRKRLREIETGSVKPVSWSKAHRTIFGSGRGD